MKLVIVSHKETWVSPTSPTGLVTVGGFPIQIGALSGLFDATIAVVTVRRGQAPPNAIPLSGVNLEVLPMPQPKGRGIARKIFFLPWLLRNGRPIWRAIRNADAVHALVPGDLGFLGLLVGLVCRKPLFVRYCGTWGDRSTLSNRMLAWLLPKIAGGKVVVLATGGGGTPPELRNRAIQWIFATSLTQNEYENIRPATPWRPGEPLRLVTVGRLTKRKNALSCIGALPAIRIAFPGSTLAIVGEGPFRGVLEKEVTHLGLDGAVVFHGHLNHEEVLDRLSDSHLFLFPTRVAEGFPKAVLEALACGLPVVVSSVSVLPHLIGGGCGVVLQGTGAQEVASAVLDLAGDPARMAAMGRAARKTAGSYTLERWCDLIRGRLESAWDRHLRSGTGDPPVGDGTAG